MFGAPAPLAVRFPGAPTGVPAVEAAEVFLVPPCAMAPLGVDTPEEAVAAPRMEPAAVPVAVVR
ncbi:MAG: hypothetical protein ACRYHQ_15350 [Janthinobacterium lividum]